MISLGLVNETSFPLNGLSILRMPSVLLFDLEAFEVHLSQYICKIQTTAQVAQIRCEFDI